jgi:predicted DNA-binding transcriptional regulator AlpA
MKLIDLLTPGKPLKTVPRSEIPGLLGELETLTARLWVRLVEWEDMQVLIARNPARNTGHPIQVAKQPSFEPQGRVMRMKEVVKVTGLSRATLYQMQRQGDFPRATTWAPAAWAGWTMTSMNGLVRGLGRGMAACDPGIIGYSNASSDLRRLDPPPQTA